MLMWRREEKEEEEQEEVMVSPQINRFHSFILSGGLEHVIGWYLRPWKVSKNKPKNQPTQRGDKTRIHMGINTD